MLNSKDDILHPVGNGVLPRPSANGGAALGDAGKANELSSSPESSAVPTTFTTLTLTSDPKPSLENRNLGTA